VYNPRLIIRTPAIFPNVYNGVDNSVEDRRMSFLAIKNNACALLHHKICRGLVNGKIPLVGIPALRLKYLSTSANTYYNYTNTVLYIFRPNFIPSSHVKIMKTRY
jgi:hypothetical protein